MPVIWGEGVEKGLYGISEDYRALIRIVGISYTPKTKYTIGWEVEEIPEGARYYDPATGEFFTEEEVEEE